jgi:hypothetical protein
MSSWPSFETRALISTIHDGLAIARPARVRALLRMRSFFLVVRSPPEACVSNHEAGLFHI